MAKRCEQCDGSWGNAIDPPAVCNGCKTGKTPVISEDGYIIGEAPYISKKDRADGVVLGPGSITYYDIPRRF